LAVVGYLLLILIPAAVVAYIVWDYKRKMADREAASAGRLHELLGIAALPQPQRSRDTEGLLERAAPAPPAPASAAEPAPAAQPRWESAPAAPLYAARERILSPPQTLLYYLLKTGLPDHVIFPRVTLASILEAGPGLSGFARDEQIRRLAALTVEFVVADKTMRPLAVIELAAPAQPGAAQADRDAARTRLEAAGVKYLELDAKALPRKETIRALVLDDDETAGALRATPENAPH